MAVAQGHCMLQKACSRLQASNPHPSRQLRSSRYGDALFHFPLAKSFPLSIRESHLQRSSRRRRGVCSCSQEGDPNAVVAAAIYEVEVLVREPQQVLNGMRDLLSAQDLQLILLYFSQQGRDAWYALEVFDWMQGAGRAGDDVHDLMMVIMFKWLMHVVDTGGSLGDVNSLLQDMACVSLQPEPDILQALACAFWDRGSKDDAVEFALHHVADDDQSILVALMWRMMRSNSQRQAMDLVQRVHEGEKLKLSFHVYNVALLAAVSEQQQLTHTLRDLRTYQKRGMVGALEETDKALIREYEMKIHGQAERIAGWALEEHHANTAASIHQKLLAMYCVAGHGLEAMRALWRLKHTGKTIHARFFNVVLGICAYGNHQQATRLILNTMKEEGPVPDKTSYAALFGGFANGGHTEAAIHAILEMLDEGFLPDKNAVLVAMKQLSKANDFSLIRKLGERLVQAELVDPFVIYMYIDPLKLSIILLL